MELPKLPDLEEIVIKKDDRVDQENRQTVQKESKIKNVFKKKRPRIPKTEYDIDGDPILSIPDLNDIELTSEIDKYFGSYEEED